ncbi:hypothetical protein [Rubritalea tangerina]|uniref:Uncharacterized protein n=1 Tax=Rubritalea tangerina TaxID=430798 RepID=A0ABW4ZAU3_9BACT
MKNQLRYLFEGHKNLLTETEAAAWNNLLVERKIALCQYPAVKMLFKTRCLDNSPEVTAHLIDGSDAFYKRTLERLSGQTNHCPSCGALCRTSKARLCPECSHTWFETYTPR